MKTLLLFAVVLAGASLSGAAVITKIEAESVLDKEIKLRVNKLQDPYDILRQEKKDTWSGKSTVRFRKVEKDIDPATAPQLKFKIEIPADGRYSIYANTLTSRFIGYSVDGGKTWHKMRKRHCIASKKICKKGDVIEIIASACYASPHNPGDAYLDFFELIKL